jgi:hypothetical protein
VVAHSPQYSLAGVQSAGQEACVTGMPHAKAVTLE